MPDTLRIDAAIPEVVRQRTPRARFTYPLAGLVAALPALPDTEAGRVRRRQIKTLLLIVGLLITLASYKSRLAIGLGASVMISSLWVPVSAGWRLRAAQRLRRAGSQAHTIEHAAVLEHDGRRLSLSRDGERVHRVLVNRPFSLSLARQGAHTWVGVAPLDAKKKRDTLWFRVATPPRDEFLEFDPALADPPLLIHDAEAGQRLLLTLERDHQIAHNRSPQDR